MRQQNAVNFRPDDYYLLQLYYNNGQLLNISVILIITSKLLLVSLDTTKLDGIGPVDNIPSTD